MHPTLAGLYPFLLGSLLGALSCRILCLYICLGSPARSRLSCSAVALTEKAFGNHKMCLEMGFSMGNTTQASSVTTIGHYPTTLTKTILCDELKSSTKYSNSNYIPVSYFMVCSPSLSYFD